MTLCVTYDVMIYDSVSGLYLGPVISDLDGPTCCLLTCSVLA